VCIERIEHALFRIEETEARVRFILSDQRSTSAERESATRSHRSAEQEFYVQYANVVRVLPIVKAGIALVDLHSNDCPEVEGFDDLVLAVQQAEGEWPREAAGGN
jgi:sRNA-binding protein